MWEEFLKAKIFSCSFRKGLFIILNVCLLTVNVDGAVDDIVHHFNDVSDELTRDVVSPMSSLHCRGSSTSTDNDVLNADEVNKIKPSQDGKHDLVSEEVEHAGWHSDIELSPNGSPLHLAEECDNNNDLDEKHDLVSETRAGKETSATNFTFIPDHVEEVPPEVY